MTDPRPEDTGPSNACIIATLLACCYGVCAVAAVATEYAVRLL